MAPTSHGSLLVPTLLKPDAFKKLVDTIKLISETNHWKINPQKTLDVTTTHSRNIQKWIRVTYLEKLSSLISRLLKPTSLQDTLFSKSLFRLEKECGIYRLECDPSL
jgi:hypothetical protein